MSEDQAVRDLKSVLDELEQQKQPSPVRDLVRSQREVPQPTESDTRAYASLRREFDTTNDGPLSRMVGEPSR